MGWRDILRAAAEGAVAGSRAGMGAYSRGGAFGGLSELLSGGQSTTEEDRRIQRFGSIAIRAFRDAQARWNDDGSHGRRLQYQDREVKVEATNGYDRYHDCYTTDVLVYDRTSRTGGHLHIIFDEDGNEIYSRWNEGYGPRRR